MKKLLAILLLFSTGVFAQEKPAPRLISVTGEAEIRVVPDEVVLSLSIETTGKTLMAAKADHDARVKAALEVARTSGVAAKDIRTSQLKMGPKYEEIKERQVLVGYEVSQSLSVVIRDLSKYEGLLTKLLEAGVNNVDGIDFRVRDVQKYREQVRILAVRAAREKAAAMASELGQKLGPPHSITESDSWPGLNANIAYGVVGPPEETRATISAGELIVRARIAVSFELQ